MSHKGYDNNFIGEGTVNVMKHGLTEIIILHDNNAPVPNFEEHARKHGRKFFNGLKDSGVFGEVRVTLAAFGEGYKFYNNSTPIAAVRPVAKNFANGNGVRNVFDTLANTMNEKGRAYSNTDESEHPENVIFVLTTFGRDNASKSFAYSRVAEMIAHQSYVYKWNFICMTNEQLISSQLELHEESVIRIDSEDESFWDKALTELSEKIRKIIQKA